MCNLLLLESCSLVIVAFTYSNYIKIWFLKSLISLELIDAVVEKISCTL